MWSTAVEAINDDQDTLFNLTNLLNKTLQCNNEHKHGCHFSMYTMATTESQLALPL